MKLKEINLVTKKIQASNEVENVISVVTEAPSHVNHHRGILHVMGIDPNSPEYEEESADLERLSRTNPTLYRKIINMD